MSESPGVVGADPLANAGKPSGGEWAWRDRGLLFGVDLGEPCVCKVRITGGEIYDMHVHGTIIRRIPSKSYIVVPQDRTE